MFNEIAKYQVPREPGMRQLLFKFDNDYGCSLIQSQYTFGGDKGLFEIAVIHWDTDTEWHIDYTTPIADDVLGYLTKLDVIELCDSISKLPEKNKCIMGSHKALTCDAKTLL